MFVLKKFILVILLFELVGAGYLVTLKKPFTLGRLLDNDDADPKIGSNAHIRKFIERKFSFGGFEGFCGDFSEELAKRLARSSYVAEIVSDSIIKANEMKKFDSKVNEDGFVKLSGYEISKLGPHQIQKLIRKMVADGIKLKTLFQHKSSKNRATSSAKVHNRSDVFDMAGYLQKFNGTCKNPMHVFLQAATHHPNFYDTQPDAPRHLARLSRRAKLPSNKPVNYYYDSNFKGKGVYSYIIDTGIYKEHPEFQGRAMAGADFTSEGPGDLNGHGTHVAGIVGSKTYGVAKEVTLVEVKALDKNGQGALSSVIAALQFVVDDSQKRGVKAVANLSLGSLKNPIVDQAISAAVDSGVLVVVAAGNSNVDACLTSPASSNKAITVGALNDLNDAVADFSNWGECVDVFASGVSVESLSIEDSKRSHKTSGTSMASPAVAGLSAIFLEMGVPPDEVNRKLSDLATYGSMNSRSLIYKPFTLNKLINNGITKEDDYYSPTPIGDPSDENYFEKEDRNSYSVNPSFKSSQIEELDYDDIITELSSSFNMSDPNDTNKKEQTSVINDDGYR